MDTHIACLSIHGHEPMDCSEQITYGRQGSGLESLCRNTGEAIEVLALPVAQAESFEKDEDMPKSAGLLFGLMWLRNQKQQGLV